MNDRKSANRLDLKLSDSDSLFNLYKKTVLKLEAIKAISPSLINDVKINGNYKDENTQKTIDLIFNKLPQSSIDMFNMRKRQSELKSNPSTDIIALDLALGKDYVKHLCGQLKKECKEIKSDSDLLLKIKTDAIALHNVLTPGLVVKSADSKYIQYNITQLKNQNPTANPPDAILIMGNNDLIQVKFIASIYHALEKKPDVYISGYGGHGTVPGTIFKLSEAKTIEQCIIEHGVPKSKIYIETDAVDTGKNVQKSDILMLIQFIIKEKAKLITMGLLNQNKFELISNLKIKLINRTITSNEQDSMITILNPVKKYLIDNKIALYENILISGTPAGLLRQFLTYKKQTTLPWKSISCINPGNDHLMDKYYNTLKNASINLLYVLREVASYFDYIINTDFLPSESIGNDENLKQIIPIFVRYYNMLTNNHVSCDEFIDLYFKFTQCKFGNNSLNLNMNALSEKANTFIQPMASYFRSVFLEVENRWIKKLTISFFSPADQSAKVDPDSVYNRFTIDPVKKDFKYR